MGKGRILLLQKNLCARGLHRVFLEPVRSDVCKISEIVMIVGIVSGFLNLIALWFCAVLRVAVFSGPRHMYFNAHQ